MNVADTVVPLSKVFSSLFVQRKQVDRPNLLVKLGLHKQDENRARYLAQSILTCLIPWPDIPSYAEALDILNWAQQGK